MKYSIVTILPFATAALAAQGPIVDKGCHSMPLTKGTSQDLVYNSPGQCADLCFRAQKPIAYLHKESCLCADEAPTDSSLLSNEQCDAPCPGFAATTCGGEDAFSVIETGYRAGSAQEQGPISSSVTSAPPTATASSIPDADPVVYGCYASVDGEATSQRVQFNSYGLCAQICRGQQKTTALLRDSECKCTNGEPVAADQLGADQCANPCPGFAKQMCGGDKGFTVLDTGYEGGAQSTSVAAHSTASATAAAAGGNGSASALAPSTPTSIVPVAGAVSVRGFSGGVVAGVLGVAAYNLF